MNHSAFTSRGPPIEARRDHHNPHAGGRSYHTQQRSDNVLISAGPSGERTNILGHAEPGSSHSHSDREAEDEGYLAEFPPKFRSDRLPGQPAGIQHRRSASKAKQITDLDKTAPAQRHAHRRDFQEPTTVEVSFQTRV